MSKTTKSELMKRLAEIEKEYKEKLDNVEMNKLELERLEYDAPTDDEIINIAKASLAEKYNTQKNRAQTSTEQKRLSIAEAISKAVEDAREKEQNLASSYENAKDNVEEQAIKRGMQRSSVVLNQLGELEGQKLSELGSIATNLENTVYGLNTQISALEEDLQKSINELNMLEAVELSEKIEELKDKRDKKQTEVIKYNNSATEAEAKYNSTADNKKAEEEKKAIELDLTKAKLNEVIEYYFSFDNPEDALKEFLADEDIKKVLGTKYYNYVYNALKVR